jgi:hypothetical protein
VDNWSSEWYSPPSRWTQNGGLSWTDNNNRTPYTWDYNYYGFLTFPSNGSLVLNTAIPESNTNDYEINSTLGLKSGYGTYIHFVRTSSAAVQAGSGSYISAEIAMPAVFQQTGVATLNINQCINGTVTRLAQSEIIATDGMQFRTVVFGTNFWVFINDQMVAALTISLTSGNGVSEDTRFRQAVVSP